MNTKNSFFYDLNYSELVHEVSSGKKPADYSVLRALIVLGKFTEAQSQLNSKKSHLDSWTLNFIQYQLDLYEGKATFDQAFKILSSKIPEKLDPLLKAELFFVSGFSANKECHFHSGMTFNQMARSLYKQAGYKNHEGLCLFNEYNAACYLGHFDIAEKCFQELAELAKVNLVLKQHSLRLHAYRLAANDQYQQASVHLREAISLALNQDRAIDALNASVVLVWVLIRSAQLGTLSEHLGYLNILQEKTNIHTFQKTIDLLTSLVSSNREDEASLRTFSKVVKNVEPLHSIYCWDVFLSKVQLSGDYALLLQCTQTARRSLGNLHLSPFSMDLRSYEVDALIGSGRYEQAEILLEQYKRSAKESKYPARLEKAKQLQEALSFQLCNFKPVNHNLEFNYFEKTAFYRGRRFDLSRHVTLFRLLDSLIKSHPKEIPIDTLFKKIFESEYNPLTHLYRFNSLLNRFRSYFGSKDILVRAGNCVSLNPSLHVSFNQEKPEFSSRKQQILNFGAARGRAAFTLGELQPLFPKDVRTLQRDIQSLVRANLLERVGKTKNCSYRVAIRTQPAHEVSIPTQEGG